MSTDLSALPPPTLDRLRHAAPQVLDYLRERIISLELPPGSVISRGEFAARFGLSQTPLREALIRLAEEGLVEVYAQHKTVVSRIDIRAAQQAHFLRCSIELEVVRVLAQGRDAALARELQEIIARQKRAHAAGDFGAFSDADQAFHRRLYQAAGVPDLYDIVRRQSGHIDRLRRLHVPVPGKAAAIVADHKRIVEAIAEGKPAAATERLREHLSGTLSWVDAVRKKYPSYVAN